MTMQEPNQNEGATFLSFLGAHISKADYDNLPALLGVSTRKFNRLEKNPGEWTGELAVLLAATLDGGASTVLSMVDQFQLGYSTMTVGEYNALKNLADKEASINELIKS